MHFKGEALDAMFAGKFSGISPVRDDLFFTLPVLHICVFRRPAVGDPIRLRVLRSTAWTAGEADNDFDLEHFGELDGLSKSVNVLFRVLRIGMDGIAMAAESGHANSAVFKFFQPGFGFGAISNEIV